MRPDPSTTCWCSTAKDGRPHVCVLCHELVPDDHGSDAATAVQRAPGGSRYRRPRILSTVLATCGLSVDRAIGRE